MFWFSSPDPQKIKTLKKCLKKERASYKRIVAHNKQIDINHRICIRKHCATQRQKIRTLGRKPFRDCQIKHCRKTQKRYTGRLVKFGPRSSCKNYDELEQYL